MITSLRRLLLGVLLAGAVAACGGDESSVCLEASDSDARICLVEEGGRSEVRATGLEPGSELTISVDGAEPQQVNVGADGEPEDELGIAGAGDVAVQVVATGAGGEAFDGELRLP